MTWDKVKLWFTENWMWVLFPFFILMGIIWLVKRAARKARQARAAAKARAAKKKKNKRRR